MTVYVVSGFMRSGTTMIMQSLDAGGMECLRSDSRDAFVSRYSDGKYRINPHGLYELEPEEIAALTLDLAEGKVLKLLLPLLSRLPVFPQIKCIFMLRSAKEIKHSILAAVSSNEWKDTFKTDIDLEVGIALKRLRNRRDVELLCLNYDDVIEWPEATMRMLLVNGWPINVQDAATVPNRARKRFNAGALAAFS